MKKGETIKTLSLVTTLFLSMYISSVPLAFAACTIDDFDKYMPPDLYGDINYDGKIDLQDVYTCALAFATFPGDQRWNRWADINSDGTVDLYDYYWICKNYGKEENPETPIAYSTTFEFTVPEDGDEEVWYYILARIYVPPELSGQNFYFVATADDSVQNIKLDAQLKAGSGSSVNIDLGSLSSGYHLLEFEFVETTAAGLLNFHVATTAEEYAWLIRFRICIPDYSDTEYRYTVKAHTNFPRDYYFLAGEADDFVDDVYIDEALVWQDWEWDSKYGIVGDIFAWDFLYPLSNLEGWKDVCFTFGEIWDAGVLDFQFLSRTHHQVKIGNPKFWATISNPTSPYPPSDPRYLKIYGIKAWAGSKWTSTPGSSRRLIAVGIRVLANATDTYTFYPIPQEAEVTLFLELPSSKWPLNSPQDIGLHINLTYTYFDEKNFVYSFPIWFEAYEINVTVPTQGYMLYIPNPSIVFTTQSATSYITPEWKAAWDVVEYLQAAFITTLACPIGVPIAAWNYWKLEEMKYKAEQQLNSTSENWQNPPTYRLYVMNIFKTTEEQQPLADPVRSISNGFFLRFIPSAALHCGGVTINLQGRLWLPFFYNNPPPDAPGEYGEWLPVELKICLVFPVFVED